MRQSPAAWIWAKLVALPGGNASQLALHGFTLSIQILLLVINLRGLYVGSTAPGVKALLGLVLFPYVPQGGFWGPATSNDSDSAQIKMLQ